MLPIDTTRRTTVTDIKCIVGNIYLAKCWNTRYVFVDTPMILDVEDIKLQSKKDYRIDIHITRKFNTGYLITIIWYITYLYYL